MVDFNIEDVSFSIDESYDDGVQEKIAEAEQLEADGNLNKALSYWTQLVKASPELLGPKVSQGKVYKEMGRWKQYVDSLNDIANALPDEMMEEKVAILKITIPILNDEMKLPPKVMDAYKRILEINPDDQEAFDNLVEIIENMSRWPDLAKLYQSRLEQLTDDFDKIPLLEKIAVVYDDKLRNKREAVKAYEALFAIDPTHQGAVENLKAIYEQSRDYESLIALSQKEMEQLTDMTAIREKTIEIAEMAASKIKKPETLIELWEKVLEVDDENLQALEELEQLYERAKDYEKMVKTCQKLIEILDDNAKRVAVCMKAAPILQDKLEKLEEATQMWRLLLELEPDNRRAQDSLKKLLVTSESWDELETLFTEWDKLEEYIRIISKHVESIEEVEPQLELLFREARLWRENLDKSDRAMKALEKILTIDTSNLEAAEILIQLYEEAGQHKKLPEVLEIRINNTEDEYSKRERIEELANIYNEHLRDKESSFTWYLKAITLDPERIENRTHAEELAPDVKDGWKRLVEDYEGAYKSFGSIDEALPLMHVVARAQEMELGDKDNALITCKRILEIEDSNMDALNSCERIYNDKQSWEELLEIYSKKIELIFEDEDKKAIYWKKAEIYDSLLEKPEEAVICYNEVLDFLSDDLETLAQLDALYVRLEKWEELAEVLVKELDLSDA
ncbi:hypothetical protein KKF84_08205, partial [Myxococcota bacterium]|nr:hypothetical protein [Myxococcota bacterium]